MGNVQRKNRIYLSPPHISGLEDQYIKEAIETNWISSVGKNIDCFEQQLKLKLNAPDVVAVSSGTAAIHLALRLLNVKDGDHVFCSSLTFIASCNPVIYQGATPIFIDSEYDSWCMSPEALEAAFENAKKNNKLPKAVIVVDLYGQVAKMNEIQAICDYYSVPIIEDAAEALGSSYGDKLAGTFGQFGIISFNGNKIITTSGGGALICQNGHEGEKVRFLASQAKDPALYYEHSQIGYNYRMSNILAGIGRGQLEVLEDRINRRRRIFETYVEELSTIPGLYFMPELEKSKSNRWLTALTVNEEITKINALELVQILANENIEARPVWKPMHLQPVFKNIPYFQHKDTDVSRHLFETGICLPSGSNLTEDDQLRVIETIKKAIRYQISIA